MQVTCSVIANVTNPVNVTSSGKFHYQKNICLSRGFTRIHLSSIYDNSTDVLMTKYQPFCHRTYLLDDFFLHPTNNSELSFSGSDPTLLFSSSGFATCGQGRFVVATTAESSLLSRKLW